MIWSWFKHAEFGYGQTIGDPAGDFVTVAFPNPTGIRAVPVSDVIFLRVVEVARLRKIGVLPSGKSPWNGNCAPRQLGFRKSNWKHNPQIGERGGVHLKTKFTEGGWPVFGKRRGGRQRFREDWNADTCLRAEVHDAVGGNRLMGLDAEEFVAADTRSSRAEAECNRRLNAELRSGNGDRRALEMALAAERREERMQRFDSETRQGHKPSSEAAANQYDPVRDEADEVADIQVPTNGNGKVYSTIMRGISSKSPLRLKLRAYKLHEIKGVPVDDVADLLKVPRATVREWHRLGWFTEAERDVLRKIGSNGKPKKPPKS